MLNTSLGYILVRSFPECAVMLLAACNFLNFKISRGTLLKKTFILGMMISFIRMLPISFGIHTIIGMGMLLFVLADVSKKSFIDCITAICKLFLCLAFSEVIYVSLITTIFSIPQSVLVDNYSIASAIYTLPSLIILGGLCYLAKIGSDKIKERIGANNNEKYNGKPL